jgi:protein SCO1/2
LTRFIADPGKVRSEGDPIARALAERFSTVRMPNLGLSEQDASDLVAYADAMTYAVKADERNPKVVHDHHAQHDHKH